MTKMPLSVIVKGSWRDFTIIIWIIEYLQTPIYIWNKISKHTMSQYEMDFQYTLIHLFLIFNIMNKLNVLMLYLNVCMFSIG